MFQFTVRSLLLLMFLLAVAGSYMAWKRNIFERQASAAKRIEQMGGRVQFEPRAPEAFSGLIGTEVYCNVADVDISNRPLPAEAVDCLARLVTARGISLDGTVVRDADLQQIGGLRGLVYVDLSNTRISDEGLKGLARLVNLETLNLNNTNITDEGIQHLRGMRRLTTLSLRNTRITDAALEVIGGLRLLTDLDLSGTAVYDAGAPQLRRLNRLYQLVVERSRMTQSGQAALQRDLPKLVIVPDSYAADHARGDPFGR